MSCDTNRKAFFTAIGREATIARAFGWTPEQGAVSDEFVQQTVVPGLERIFNTARRSPANVLEAMNAELKTRAVVAEVHARSADREQPWVLAHNESGIPEGDAQPAYAIIHDTLHGLRTGGPLPDLAQQVIAYQRRRRQPGASTPPATNTEVGQGPAERTLAAPRTYQNGQFRCPNCGRYAARQGTHLCPQTATAQTMARHLARRLKLPPTAYDAQALQQVIAAARASDTGTVRMRHGLTGEVVEVTLDGTLVALQQGYTPELWRDHPGCTQVQLPSQKIVTVLNATGLNTVAADQHTAFAQAAAAYGLVLALDTQIDSAGADRPILAEPHAADETQLVGGERYDRGRLLGTEYRRGGSRGSEVRACGRAYVVGDRSLDRADWSTARRRGHAPAPTRQGIAVGRTLVEAVEILRNTHVAAVRDHVGTITRVELYTADGGSLLAIYDPATQQVGSTELRRMGDSPASPAQMAVLMAAARLLPLGMPTLRAALDEDLEEAHAGTGSPLAAADSAYLLLDRHLASGQVIHFGATVETQRCLVCGQWMGSQHSCPGASLSDSGEYTQPPVVEIARAALAADRNLLRRAGSQRPGAMRALSRAEQQALDDAAFAVRFATVDAAHAPSPSLRVAAEQYLGASDQRRAAGLFARALAAEIGMGPAVPVTDRPTVTISQEATATSALGTSSIEESEVDPTDPPALVPSVVLAAFQSVGMVEDWSEQQERLRAAGELAAATWLQAHGDTYRRGWVVGFDAGADEPVEPGLLPADSATDRLRCSQCGQYMSATGGHACIVQDMQSAAARLVQAPQTGRQDANDPGSIFSAARQLLQSPNITLQLHAQALVNVNEARLTAQTEQAEQQAARGFEAALVAFARQLCQAGQPERDGLTVGVGPGASVSGGEVFRYEHFIQAEYRRPGSAGTVVQVAGNRYRVGERSFSQRDWSRNRRNGSTPPPPAGIVVGRTLVAALGVLEQTVVHRTPDDVFELYSADRSELLAVYDPAAQALGTTSVLQTGESLCTSEQMALIIAERSWNAGDDRRCTALRRDVIAALNGTGSPLAAADSAYIVLTEQMFVGPDGILQFGGQVQAQQCPACGRFMGSHHICPASANEDTTIDGGLPSHLLDHAAPQQESDQVLDEQHVDDQAEPMTAASVEPHTMESAAVPSGSLMTEDSSLLLHRPSLDQEPGAGSQVDQVSAQAFITDAQQRLIEQTVVWAWATVGRDLLALKQGAHLTLENIPTLIHETLSATISGRQDNLHSVALKISNINAYEHPAVLAARAYCAARDHGEVEQVETSGRALVSVLYRLASEIPTTTMVSGMVAALPNVVDMATRPIENWLSVANSEAVAQARLILAPVAAYLRWRDDLPEPLRSSIMEYLESPTFPPTTLAQALCTTAGVTRCGACGRFIGTQAHQCFARSLLNTLTDENGTITNLHQGVSLAPPQVMIAQQVLRNAALTLSQGVPEVPVVLAARSYLEAVGLGAAALDQSAARGLIGAIWAAAHGSEGASQSESSVPPPSGQAATTENDAARVVQPEPTLLQQQVARVVLPYYWSLMHGLANGSVRVDGNANDEAVRGARNLLYSVVFTLSHMTHDHPLVQDAKTLRQHYYRGFNVRWPEIQEIARTLATHVIDQLAGTPTSAIAAELSNARGLASIANASENDWQRPSMEETRRKLYQWIQPTLTNLLERNDLPPDLYTAITHYLADQQSGPVRLAQQLCIAGGVDRCEQCGQFRSSDHQCPSGVRITTAAGNILNLNTMTADELLRLPGIGPAMVERILDERALRPFTSISDLERVNGIGESAVRRITDALTRQQARDVQQAVQGEQAYEHDVSTEAQARARDAWNAQPDEVPYSANMAAFQDDYDAAKERQRRGEAVIPYYRENALGGLGDRNGGRPFGLEIEFSGGDRAAIGRDLHAAGLTTTPSQETYHSGTRSHGQWSFERDGTVDGEIVSPLLYDEPETWEQLAQVCEIVKRHGGRVSASCGGHIHVGAGDYDHTPDNHYRLQSIVAKHQDLMFRLAMNPAAEAHRGDHYCRRVGVPQVPYTALTDLPTRRYSAVNWLNVCGNDNDHVEFRLYDGSLDPGTIQAQIKLSLAITQAAFRSTNEEVKQMKRRLRGWHAERNPGTPRLTGTAWEQQTANIRQFADTLFKRRADKAQIAALFAATRWQKKSGGSQFNGPKPEPPTERASEIVGPPERVTQDMPTHVAYQIAHLINAHHQVTAPYDADRVQRSAPYYSYCRDGNGDVVGFVRLHRPQVYQAEFAHLTVAEGRDEATLRIQLMRATEEQAAAMGIELLQLPVSEDDTATQEALTQHGYQRVSTFHSQRSGASIAVWQKVLRPVPNIESVAASPSGTERAFRQASQHTEGLTTLTGPEFTTRQAEQAAALMNVGSQYGREYSALGFRHRSSTYIGVAASDGELVGCVETKKINWYQYEIKHVSVAEGHTHQGYGERLVQMAEDQARSNNAWIVQATTPADNAAGRALFARLGYQRVSVFQRVTNGQAIEVWQKVLAPADSTAGAG